MLGSRKLNQSGLSLVEVMVVVGIMSIVVAGTSQMMFQMLRGQNTIKMRLAVQDLRENIRVHLVNEEAWENALSHIQSNGGTCLMDNASGYECNSQVDVPQGIPKLFDAAGNEKENLHFWVPGGNKGYSTEGSRCFDYPSQACPIAVELSWVPEKIDPGSCTSSDCKRPSAVISIDFHYDPEVTPLGPFNIDRFDMTITKPGVPMTLAVNCAAVGGVTNPTTGGCELPMDPQAMCQSFRGTYDPQNRECTLPTQAGQSPAQACQLLGGNFNTQAQQCDLATNPQIVCQTVGGTWSNGNCQLTQVQSGNCQPGEVVVGVSSSGAAECTPFTTMVSQLGTCPDGQMLKGFSPTGTPVCRTLAGGLGSCATGLFIQGFQTDGTVICASGSANSVSGSIAGGTNTSGGISMVVGGSQATNDSTNSGVSISVGQGGQGGGISLITGGSRATNQDTSSGVSISTGSGGGISTGSSSTSNGTARLSN